jgi:hypothetical protein
MKVMIEWQWLCDGLGLKAKTNRKQYYHGETRSQGDPPNLIQSIPSTFGIQYTSR